MKRNNIIFDVISSAGILAILISVVLMAAADFEHVFASWGFINGLSHGATIIGTGMKYFSKASKAIQTTIQLIS